MEKVLVTTIVHWNHMSVAYIRVLGCIYFSPDEIRYSESISSQPFYNGERRVCFFSLRVIYIKLSKFFFVTDSSSLSVSFSFRLKLSALNKNKKITQVYLTIEMYCI